MQSSTFSESLALLRTRRFGTFFLASLLSNIGTWAQYVAEPWLLLSLGASPFLVGLDAFALSAPGLLLTLVGGVLADRADRRRVIATFQSIQMLCPTILAVLLLIGTVRPWIVIVLSLVVGAIWLLSVDPARDRRHLSSGFALGYGTILVLVALNPWFWGLPVLLGLAGFSMSISNTSAYSLLQTTASLSLRGQAISLYMLAMGAVFRSGIC